MNDSRIRSCVPADLPALKAVIDAVELFASDALDGMVSFETPPAAADEPREFWLVHDDEAGLQRLRTALPSA